MGSFTKGDIVLFPFPFTDLSNRKLRPCLVISDEMNEDIVLCQITSQRIRKDQYCVEIGKNEIVDGTLRIDGYIRTNMIFTANKKQIQNRICRIKGKEYENVVDFINDLIKK